MTPQNNGDVEDGLQIPKNYVDDVEDELSYLLDRLYHEDVDELDSGTLNVAVMLADDVYRAKKEMESDAPDADTVLTHLDNAEDAASNLEELAGGDIVSQETGAKIRFVKRNLSAALDNIGIWWRAA
jgi:hypothetical protein